MPIDYQTSVDKLLVIISYDTKYLGLINFKINDEK